MKRKAGAALNPRDFDDISEPYCPGDLIDCIDGLILETRDQTKPNNSIIPSDAGVFCSFRLEDLQERVKHKRGYEWRGDWASVFDHHYRGPWAVNITPDGWVELWEPSEQERSRVFSRRGKE